MNLKFSQELCEDLDQQTETTVSLGQSLENTNIEIKEIEVPSFLLESESSQKQLERQLLNWTLQPFYDQVEPVIKLIARPEQSNKSMSNQIRSNSLKKRQRSPSHDIKEEGLRGNKRKDAVPNVKPYMPNELNTEIKHPAIYTFSSLVTDFQKLGTTESISTNPVFGQAYSGKRSISKMKESSECEHSCTEDEYTPENSSSAEQKGLERQFKNLTLSEDPDMKFVKQCMELENSMNNCSLESKYDFHDEEEEPTPYCDSEKESSDDDIPEIMKRRPIIKQICQMLMAPERLGLTLSEYNQERLRKLKPIYLPFQGYPSFDSPRSNDDEMEEENKPEEFYQQTM